MKYIFIVAFMAIATAGAVYAQNKGTAQSRLPGLNAEFQFAGPAGRDGFVSTEKLFENGYGHGFNGGDGVQHEICRVIARWGDENTKQYPLTRGSVEVLRVNSFNDRELAWRAVADKGDGGEPMKLRPLEPTVLLADGTPFLTWEQPAKHKRTFYLDQAHPDASDANPGTEAKPWKTIGKAAASLQPSDRVLVKKGVYREWVRPARGGTGPEAMITYEAAEPGVVISGAQVFEGPWRPSEINGEPTAPNSFMAELPDAMFVDEVYGPYNPFRLNKLMDAYGAVPGTLKQLENPRSRFHEPRGMVFQDGCRLTYQHQLKGGRARIDPGSWHLERGAKVLVHVRPFDKADIEVAKIEVISGTEH